jgi:hypothetical protein
VEDSVGLLTINGCLSSTQTHSKERAIRRSLQYNRALVHCRKRLNPKHTDWGSKLITPRGCEVLKTMDRNNFKHLSTGELTYWPSDRNKLPDLVDFCVTKGIPQDFTVAKSCFEQSSDHSLVLITLPSHALNQEKQPSLSNRHTNWDDFRHLINQRITLNVSLKTKEDIEVAIKFFNNTVQWAGWNATPEHRDTLNT